VNAENTASERLLKKLGFQKAGRLVDKEHGDVNCFEIRRADFAPRRKDARSALL
jgi:RimJ/RimL family protein N-acetyltransferase